MRIWFFIFYEFILWVGALLVLPKTLYSMIVHKKYRSNLLLRFGINYPNLEHLPQRPFWIHAVSVGETKAVVSLARELKRRFPDHPIIISNVTETGHAEAKKSLPFADYHLFLPFDCASVVAPIIEKASPSLVVLCESDFWYHFLYFSKKQGAQIVLVNGKLSEKSRRRFSFFSAFSRPLFRLFDVICVQNELYKNRFLSVGVACEKLFVTGNLKLDEEYPQLTAKEVALWRHRLGIEENQQVLTIGSTHSPEEELFITILKKIWQSSPNLRVILVPRHPERFKEVAELLRKEKIKWRNYSDIAGRSGHEQVILMDSMGLLRLCYQISDFALVGGSFTDRVGGHNILEPLWYGKPVLFGPYMHTQTEFVEMVNRYGAGKQVNGKELLSVLKEWVQNPAVPASIGQNGISLVSDLKGATEKTLEAMNALLSTIASEDENNK